MFQLKSSKMLWVVLLASALVGCASTYDDGTRALQARDYALAEQLFIRAIREGDSVPESWNNLGVAYMGTNRVELAAQSFTMGARHGNENSRKNLTKLNRPIPSPDLLNSQNVPNGTGSSSSGIASVRSICNCKGSVAPGGPCYAVGPAEFKSCHRHERDGCRPARRVGDGPNERRQARPVRRFDVDNRPGRLPAAGAKKPP